MTLYAQAERTFRNTESFVNSRNPATIGAPAEMKTFLENRLIDAFRHGITAGEHIAAERLARLVKGEKL